MTRTGKRWYRPHSANPQTAFQNWWKLVLDRIGSQEENKNFPRFPFGSLRDLLPNILRAEYGDDVASIALQHGKNKFDDWLDFYANIPFRKLFNAIRELQARFRPFLDKLAKYDEIAGRSFYCRCRHDRRGGFGDHSRPSSCRTNAVTVCQNCQNESNHMEGENLLIWQRLRAQPSGGKIGNSPEEAEPCVFLAAMQGARFASGETRLMDRFRWNR
ncbi:MAG: hypothetical protein ACLQNE_13410 [Thermoguttaceae bacterium]